MKVAIIGEKCVDHFCYINKFGKITRDIHDNGLAGNVMRCFKSFKTDPDFFTNEEYYVKRRMINDISFYTKRMPDNYKKVKPFKKIPCLKNYDSIIIVDEDFGFLDESTIEEICSQNENVFIDTKKVLGNFCKKAKIVKINYNQFQKIEGNIDVYDWKDKLVITKDKQGLIYSQKIYKPKKTYPYEICAAGDAFLSKLVFNFIKTKNIEKSLIKANEFVYEIIEKNGFIAKYKRNNKIVKKLNL